jgi:hypothetical protein
MLSRYRSTARSAYKLNASTNLVLRIFGVRAGFERRLTDEDIAGVFIEKSPDLFTRRSVR